MTPDERIDRIRGDHWIAFDRATIVLNRLTFLMEMPQQSRMPGLMVYGSSGIGKTMIAKRMASKYPTQYNAELGVTKTPILLVQAPSAPDERRFYQHILATIGAPMWGRHSVSELEVRALSHLRDMDLRMLMIDEVHNLLAGSYREQRRFLNMLRFLANDLCASLVVFGVNEALEAVRGDDQLARRLDEHYLPLWEDDVEFSRLIQTLIAAMALEQRSGLTVASLRTILKVTGGVTSRVHHDQVSGYRCDRDWRRADHRRSGSGLAAGMGETRLEHSSPARCRIRVTVRPLPFRPPPERDELLSSWISRLAKANHCATEELCGYLGLGPGRVPECASELRVVHWALLCAALRRTPDEIVAMALPDTIHLPVQCVSRHDFQYCPGCVEKTPDLVLRHWRFAWALTCETCGQALAAKYPAKEVSGRLRARAVRGAEALKTAVANSDLRRLHRMYLTLYVVSMLDAGHTASVISANERERLIALAAVGVSMTRPLLGAAIILRGNDRALRELRRVFPSHRQVVERIRRLSQGLDRRLPGRCETGHPTGRRTHEMSRPNASEGALQAACQAISELGPDANCQALLTRAASGYIVIKGTETSQNATNPQILIN